MTTPLRFAATIVVVVASATATAPACVGELSIPVEAQLTCVSAADCPADLVCSVEAGLCVPPGTVVDLAAPILVSATVDVDRLGPGDTATITLTANEPIDAVTIVDELGDSLAAVIADELVTIAIDADARGRSGPVTLTATWQDAAGNSATVAVAAGPTIDLDPPLVVTDSLVVVASGNANVLSPAAPIAARADSGVNVAFTVDEVIVSATAPRLVPVASPDDAGLSLGLDGVVAIVSSGTGVTVTVPPGALQDVAGIADGAFLVVVDVVDELGNAGVLVGTAPLVVDTTPPPAPTLSLVRRAPFGDGARASASTSLAGVAADAVLVIAVPGSVSVDNAAAPPLVGRREPDDAGAFSLEIPFDIEAVRIVAVDEAGNLSEPARAGRIELVASILAPATPHRVLQRPVSGDVLVQLADRFGNDELRTGTVTTTTQPSWSPLTTRVQVRIPSPPVLAQDPVRGVTLAVAGGDTFALRGSQFVRIDVPRLPVVKGYGLATDERRGVVVLFGGDDADGVAQNGTWEWNGERWTERLRHDPAATDRPSPRVGAGVGYSPALGGVAVVNGCARDVEVGIFGCLESLVPEVWVWDGTAFSRLCGDGSCGPGPDANRPEVTVDATGALVATGGFGPFGPGAVSFPLPPAVFTFDGASWVGRCADACAEALPGNNAAYFDDGSDTIAFFGTCEGNPCTARLFDDDTLDVVLLDGSTPPIPNDFSFQERPFLKEATGRLVFAVRAADGADPGFVVGVEDGRLGTVVPSRLTPRCGGAVVENDVDGEALVFGGCSSCGLDSPAGVGGACVNPIDAVEAPGHAGLVRAGAGVSGLLRRVDTTAGTRLVRSVLNPGTGNGAALVHDVGNLATPPRLVDLGPGRSLEAAFPLADGRLAFLEGQFDEFGDGSLVDQFRALDLTRSALELICGGNCGVAGLGAFGIATAGDATVGTMLFGGDTGGGVSNVTGRLDPTGLPVGGAGPPSPVSRRHGSAAFDAASGLAWLFGGMSEPRFRTGNDVFDCGVPGGLSQCGDLWHLDGDTWQEVATADVSGFGRPQQRYSAAFGAVDGRMVLAGGRGPDFTSNVFADQTLDDAWALDASPARVPSHLLEVALTPYGADAIGETSEVRVEWCGAATDALAAAVAVEARVWVGGAWRAAALASDGVCARGTVDVADAADIVVRDGRLFVEVRPTGVSSTGRAAASLTTTSLTVTAVFSP